MTMEPEQFTLNRTDKLREDFEAKIRNCYDKIELRVTHASFHWTLGIIIPLILAIGGSAIGACYFLLNKNNESLESLRDRVIALEIKIDNLSKKSPNNH
ncbi:MAG TPA: hypothetical protein VLI69_04440 [Gammaproteobacteria bacterium]|nr:hypothetical protein [Gammaproteobacteria bacterium]